MFSLELDTSLDLLKHQLPSLLVLGYGLHELHEVRIVDTMPPKGVETT